MRWLIRTAEIGPNTENGLIMIPSFMMTQKTPFHLAKKSALVAEFIGKCLEELRTPALVIDRAVFAKNCAHIQRDLEHSSELISRPCEFRQDCADLTLKLRTK